MIINDPNGTAGKITPDGRIYTLSAVEPFMHAMAEIGRAWTLPFTQTSAANSTDNAVFHFENTSDSAFDIHRVEVSAANEGLWSLYTGRTYSSGGTAVTLRQLNTASGSSQDMTANYGTALTLAGTATLVSVCRFAADDPRDLMANQQALQIGPGDTFEVRYDSDGTAGYAMSVVIYTHGEEPWE